MIFVFVALLLDITHSTDIPSEEKLLRINEWQTLERRTSSENAENGNDGAIIDLHLFATCERFSIIFMTENEEFTRFRFKFDDLVLKKIDIDSLYDVQIPKPAKLIGSCRENSRKLLRINVRTTNESIVFQVADQIIRRPFDLPNVRDLKVLIPQNVSCCLIRALFLSNVDRRNLLGPSYESTGSFGTSSSFEVTTTTTKKKKEREFRNENEIDYRVIERVSPRLKIVVLNGTSTTSVSKAPATEFPYIEPRIILKTSTTSPLELLPSTSSPPSSRKPTNAWSEHTIGRNPDSTSTSKPKSASSWTHAVNKQWSMTFILCSVLISTIMLFLVVFGTFVVFYLITKPKGGKSPYSIDA